MLSVVVSHLSFLILVWVVYLEVSSWDQRAAASSSPLAFNSVHIECLGTRTFTHSYAKVSINMKNRLTDYHTIELH